MKKIIILAMLVIFIFCACEEGNETMYSSWGKIYVTNYVEGDGNTVSVFCGRKKTKNVIFLGMREDGESGGKGPYRVGINQKTGKVYISNYNDSTVTVIDSSTDRLINIIKNATRPNGIAVNPKTNRIYVINDTGNKVTVIDGDQDVVLTESIELSPGSGVGGAEPISISVNPNTNMIYTCNGSNTFSVINGNTNVAATYSTATLNGPRGIAVNPITNKIYITNYNSNTVSVIDAKTNTEIKDSPISSSYFANPRGIAVDTKRNYIYVTNNHSGSGNSLTVINGRNDQVIDVITGMPGAWEVAIHELSNTIFVSSPGNDALSVINGDTKEVYTMSGLSDPRGLAVKQ